MNNFSFKFGSKLQLNFFGMAGCYFYLFIITSINLNSAITKLMHNSDPSPPQTILID